MGNNYNIGIYGSRNICSIISNKNLAKYSFVSGMSIGFSGNLGYSMPSNWSFNQIYEDATLGIDNVVKSGRDNGFRNQGDDENNKDFFEQLEIIYTNAIMWAETDLNEANVLVTDYHRYKGTYDDIKWQILFGDINFEFCSYMDAYFIDNNIEFTNMVYDKYIDYEFDFIHVVGAYTGYNRYPKPLLKGETNMGDLGAWAGDFITLMLDYNVNGRKAGITITEYIENYCGTEEELNGYNSYKFEDYIGDIDGYNISELVDKGFYTSIYDATLEYYTSRSYNRYVDFFESRQNSNENVVQSLVEDVVSQKNSDPIMNLAYGLLYGSYGENYYSEVGVGLTFITTLQMKKEMNLLVRIAINK